MIPALPRLPEAPGLVEQEAYFVVHAPRQTGKTTTLRALAEELTASGRYAALWFSCETGQARADDVGAATRGILDQITDEARYALPPELNPPPWPEASDNSLLSRALTAWADACPRPLVLVFDEIDALKGAALITVLSQLRNGYTGRSTRPFPCSVALVGLRDVRDYKAAAGGAPAALGSSSPFNIKLESLRLGDFTLDEVRKLYDQHTADTGQQFAPEAVEYASELTRGQPWLVNALAREVVEKIAVPVGEVITVEHIAAAKERLILARATHLDSLAARLAEPRVRAILEPILAGGIAAFDPYDDGLIYTRDLGLIAPENPPRIANPIYHEVIPRVLASGVAATVTANPQAFVLSDGRFDFPGLLTAFAEFWAEHGRALAAKQPDYHEIAPHIVLMGFLQRIVNGGGFVDREYGIGSGRIDLLLRWPYTDATGARQTQREALELKVWRKGRSDPLRSALDQLDHYLDGLTLPTGTLIIFDGRGKKNPRPAISTTTSPASRTITLLRC
ncbi:AAA family ATPase [Frankia sp. Cpl3]|nr:AAA family ATPase [Frankia sp. Cpl3]